MEVPVCLIVNPAAGGGRAGRALPAVVGALESHGLRVRCERTRDLAHARELAERGARAGETVVCLSGDGMVGAVADVLRAWPGAVLGMLPGGRGNDLARVLGIPPDPVRACAVIAHGHVCRLDLGEAGGLDLGDAGGHAFVGIASVGFDSEANRVANRAPSWLGRLVYLYAALRVLAGWRPARFEVELDPPGERLHFTGYTVGVANSQSYGGGMRAAPDARLDDGLLDVVVLERVGKLRFLTSILPKVFSGAHVHEPGVRSFRAREVLVSADRPFEMYADGDPIASLPARVRALPGAVNVLVPPPMSATPLSAPPPSSPSWPSPSPPPSAPAGAAFAAKLSAARAVGALARVRGGGGTSLPGKLLLWLEPAAIAALAGRLGRGSAIVSATNGKTTTTAMAAGVARRAGVALVHNQAGANMAGGVASTLLRAAGRRGAMAGELGLFEVDEFWLDRLVAQLRPGAIVLGNLFRDQLDRYGELEAIADRWAGAVREGAGAEATLVCNADDPLVADVGRGRARVVYFGVQDDSLALERMAHAADAKHCRRCGAPYAFEVVYLGHLGRYRCPSCGQRRPSPTVLATDVTLEGVSGARFTLRTPAGDAEVRLALAGLYNVYNALAAAALAVALELPLDDIVGGLQATRAAFGRGETVSVGERRAHILLVKNPAGANEVLRTLALEPGSHDVLGVLNDRTADGRDVSWIWDADFELLAGRVRRVTCSGTRAAELALRLKYAGVEPERIAIEPDLQTALETAAAAERPAEDGQAPLYILPTYTAMLALRELLVRRGEASSSWR